jgi:carboxymethylenebutenolidase
VQYFIAGTVAIFAVLAGCQRSESVADQPAGDTAGALKAVPAKVMPVPDAGVARPVDAETLPYADVNESLVYGYFAFPSDMVEPLPAMLLVHDLWGLDEEMRKSANRIAAAGYIVLAVDLYAGETYADAALARQKAIAIVENPKSIEENIGQALDFVDVAGAPSVGVAGWGFGGSYALNAGLRFADRIDAVVVFYGQVSSDADRLAALEAPVLGLFGAKDSTVTPESALAFDAAMNRLRKAAEVEIYPDAGHAFADPRRSQFDAEIAAAALTRMLDFLADALAVDE